MAYYNVCQHCGGNLDPGERCDCQDEREKQQELQEFFDRHIKMEPRARQLAFVFDNREVRNESKSYC